MSLSSASAAGAQRAAALLPLPLQMQPQRLRCCSMRQPARMPCGTHALSRQRHSSLWSNSPVQPGRRWRQQLRSPRPVWAATAAGGSQPGGDDDSLPQQEQPQQEADPDLPANLPLGQSPPAEGSAEAGNPFLHNPFQDPGLRAEREKLNALHAQFVALQQQTQQRQQHPQQPAAAMAGSASAAAAAPSAASPAQSPERDQGGGDSQQQQQGRRQGLPQPLAALWAAIAGVLSRIRTALALIPAVARRLRLEALKKVRGRVHCDPNQYFLLLLHSGRAHMFL